MIRRETGVTRPDWLNTSAFGLFRVAMGNSRAFDHHDHDADEIWLVPEGRGRSETEGDERREYLYHTELSASTPACHLPPASAKGIVAVAEYGTKGGTA